MPHQSIFDALLLGLLEGATEFIPVSSTVIFCLPVISSASSSTGKAFEVLIQLGAILAILWVYAGRLIKLAADLPSSPRVRRFVLGVLITFLPAAIIGALAHDFIKTVLFETPKLICIMLIIGGVVLLFVDRWRLNPRYHEVMEFPMSAYLGIGIIQCLAMIPGTSHSGSTIVGGLLLGPDKRAAAEFSFYLVMPTMVGGIRARPLREPPHSLDADLPVIATGFIAAFVIAVFVVRYLLDYVSRQLCPVRLVAADRRRARPDRPVRVRLSSARAQKDRASRGAADRAPAA